MIYVIGVLSTTGLTGYDMAEGDPLRAEGDPLRAEGRLLAVLAMSIKEAADMPELVLEGIVTVGIYQSISPGLDS